MLLCLLCDTMIVTIDEQVRYALILWNAVFLTVHFILMKRRFQRIINY